MPARCVDYALEALTGSYRVGRTRRATTSRLCIFKYFQVLLQESLGHISDFLFLLGEPFSCRRCSSWCNGHESAPNSHGNLESRLRSLFRPRLHQGWFPLSDSGVVLLTLPAFIVLRKCWDPVSTGVGSRFKCLVFSSYFSLVNGISLLSRDCKIGIWSNHRPIHITPPQEVACYKIPPNMTTATKIWRMML